MGAKCLEALREARLKIKPVSRAAHPSPARLYLYEMLAPFTSVEARDVARLRNGQGSFASDFNRFCYFREKKKKKASIFTQRGLVSVTSRQR